MGEGGGHQGVKLQAPAEPYNLFMLAALRPVRPLSGCQTDLHLLCMPSAMRTGLAHTHYIYTHLHRYTHSHTDAHICCNYCTYEILPSLSLIVFYKLFWQFSLACGLPPTATHRQLSLNEHTLLSLPPHSPLCQGFWPTSLAVAAVSAAAAGRGASGRAIIPEMF